MVFQKDTKRGWIEKKVRETSEAGLYRETSEAGNP
jgi:hypothetical protein